MNAGCDWRCPAILRLDWGPVVANLGVVSGLAESGLIGQSCRPAPGLVAEVLTATGPMPLATQSAKQNRSDSHRLRMWSEITSPICTGGFGRTASLQDACLASCTARLAPSRASQLLGAKRGVIPDHILSRTSRNWTAFVARARLLHKQSTPI